MSRFLIVVGGVIVPAAVLPGCAITGLDGESKYACKAPEGVRCDSVSGTYYNALQNNLPAQRRSAAPPVDTSPQAAPAAARACRADDAQRLHAPGHGRRRPPPMWPRRCAPRPRSPALDQAWEDADRDLVGRASSTSRSTTAAGWSTTCSASIREPFVPIRAPRPPAATKSAARRLAPTARPPRRPKTRPRSRKPCARCRTACPPPTNDLRRHLHASSPYASASSATRRRRVQRQVRSCLFGSGTRTNRPPTSSPAGCPTSPTSTRSSCSSTRTAWVSCWR